MAVSLQRGEDNVQEPQAEEQAAGEDFRDSGSTELPTDLRTASIDKHGKADEGKDGVECDREGQSTRVYPELLVIGIVVDGSDGPSDTDSQEDVDSITSCHIANGGISVLVLDGCHLTGEGV